MDLRHHDLMGVLHRLSFIVLATVVPGCTGSERLEAIGQPDHECVARRKPVPAVPSKPIVTLQTREHAVAVHSSTAGEMRFTISSADGRVLADDLSKSEFAERFGDLHRRFEDAFAGEQLMADHTPIDASLGIPDPRD